MAAKGRPSINKRNREQARRERNTEKIQQRTQRAAVRQDRVVANPDEDPDIAGIKHGPQAPLED